MDANHENQPWQWPESPVLNLQDDAEACMLCRRNISPESGVTWDSDVFSLCGDCKFLFLEDLASPFESHLQRRTIRERSISYEHLETADNMFSRNVTHMMNIMAQDQPNVSLRGDQPFVHDSAAMPSRRSSTRTTPNGSRRWPRVPSDTESLELDSIYAGSESNFSFGGSRNFQSEIDDVSFSAYGAGSDISVDGRSFLDTDLFRQLGNDSDFDSDTDIDPMHAGGLHQWDSEEEDDDDWETDTEANPVEINEELQNSGSLISRASERNGNITLHRTSANVISLRIMERRQSYIANILANLEDSDLPPHVGNIEDSMDTAGFEAFLDHLADSETSRQGAPPAAVSFLKNMPHLVITEEHRRTQDDLTCAICKDIMFIGTEVNELPCSHVYHSYCILPWLSVRNSCPLCRFELPTDDLEYEEKRRRNNNVMRVQQQYVTDDSSSNITDDTESPPTDPILPLQGATPEACPDINGGSRDNRRGGWLYLAAPIVSIVGIALVLWLGNPLSSRRALASPHNLQEQNQQRILRSIIPSNGRRDNQRRWWALF
ncbi:unnamed protein product [Rhodiola kirilowii]